MTPRLPSRRALLLVALGGCVLDRGIDPSGGSGASGGFGGAGGAGGAPNPGGTGGTVMGGAGGAAGMGGSQTGGGGAQTGGGGAQMGGGGSAPVCGDGTIGPGEQCDGANLGGATCPAGGTPGCASCELSFATCTENCFNATDDNTNALADCDDAACAATCGMQSCNVKQLLAGPVGYFLGDTSGHADTLTNSCGGNTSVAGETVFDFTMNAANADFFVVPLSGNFDPLVRVQGSCGVDEIACVDDGLAAGEPEFSAIIANMPPFTGVFVADGFESEGSFGLVFHTYAGDNTELVAANDSKATAQAFVYPVVGSVGGSDTEDWYAFQQATPGRGLLARISGNACESANLELHDAAGALLTKPFFGTNGVCRVVLTDAKLPVGTYFIRVTAPAATSYRLRVTDFPVLP